MSQPVRIEREGDVALVAIDNPPVNAASHAVREGLADAVETLANDDGVRAIALYGAGRTFIAGADIREFGKPSKSPVLTEVCNAIEGVEKPVVAVLHGNALGGGLEVALACHARIAIEGLKVGLPEVTLGILPGAGGTQRTPRLVGIAAALDLATTGKHVGADEAHRLGLVDRVVTGEPREVALAAAREAASGALKTRRTGTLNVTPDEAALTKTREVLAKKSPHLFSPHRIVEAIAASTAPLEEGLATERRLFQECLESPQRAGLIHAFFAERAVAKVPEGEATPRPVESIGVVGGGTMGSGIATAALLAGVPVTLAERDEESLAKGRATIEGNLAGAVKRGKLSEDGRAQILAERLKTTTDYADFAAADLLIEAVFEEMAVKKEVFARLDAVAKDGALIATNTSYLDVDEIAATTSRPSDVLGLHFFSPAHIMRLLEVVVGERTAPEVVATGFALGKALRKVAVRSGVCDGFIGNRILSHYRRVADLLVLDGALPVDVDRALEDFGFAMGPFAVADLAGLDIGFATRKRRAATRPADERTADFPDAICERGWFGRKTGRGYYVYEEGGRTPNPVVEEIIAAEREAKGIAPRDYGAEEIVERYMTAMISEATRVVEEGIALAPIDVDAVLLFGYGFPRHRGGPMHHADTIGAPELVARIERYAGEDAQLWQVPDLLARMARDGGTFADLNEARSHKVS